MGRAGARFIERGKCFGRGPLNDQEAVVVTLWFDGNRESQSESATMSVIILHVLVGC